MVLIPLVVILGLFSILEYQKHRKSVQNNYSTVAAETGRIIEMNLRQDMVRSDFEAVQNLLDSIQQTQGFRDVYILDTQGEVIFASQKKNVGLQLNIGQPDCSPCHRQSSGQLPASIEIRTSDGTSMFRSVNLIQNGPACNQCHDPGQATIGLLLTDISTLPMKTALNAELQKDLIWRIFTILATILMVSLALDRFILKRLRRFSTVLRNFGVDQQAPHFAADQPDEIGKLLTTFEQMAKQVETRNQENQELSRDLKHQSEARGELLKQLITAQEKERTRVARELHDEMGQALSSLSLMTEVVDKTIKTDPDRAREYTQQIQTLIRDTTDCMYDLILDLRPSVLDDLGLVAAIRSQANRIFAGKGISLELNDRLTERLPAQLETMLYRVYQEVLSNILRHAEATIIRVDLRCSDGYFVGEVTDNGKGFLPELARRKDGSRGLGLIGMRERIEQFGGQLNIHSELGKGTRISISVPIREASND